MRILQINNTDIPGRRFNGRDLNLCLEKQGHCTSQGVLQKFSMDSNVFSFVPNGKLFNAVIRRLEYWCSIPGFVSPLGKRILENYTFRQAEIVHYHLIHNHVFSLADFPLLTTAHPSVWTWHDPWAVTGHCVHPLQCEGWKTGCMPCPHLDAYFPLRIDKSGKLWEKKAEIFTRMDIDIVVSSNFMMTFARESPLGRYFPRIHLIPFGIQLEQFGKMNQKAARDTLSIPAENYVIAFRCEVDEYKGTKYIYSLLDRLPMRKNVTILTVGFAKLPSRIKDMYHTVELGWQNDISILSAFYTACDVFLMPSIAESFGLMAVEAMASARPVICFDGTALPAVTFAPDCGISVPKGDVKQLLAAIVRLREHPEEAMVRGNLGRRLAEEHYRFEDYVRRHEELYTQVIARRR